VSAAAVFARSVERGRFGPAAAHGPTVELRTGRVLTLDKPIKHPSLKAGVLLRATALWMARPLRSGLREGGSHEHAMRLGKL
jgi:hypothetical protein